MIFPLTVTLPHHEMLPGLSGDLRDERIPQGAVSVFTVEIGRVGRESSVVETTCAENYRIQKGTTRESCFYRHMEARLKHTH